MAVKTTKQAAKRTTKGSSKTTGKAAAKASAGTARKAPAKAAGGTKAGTRTAGSAKKGGTKASAAPAKKTKAPASTAPAKSTGKKPAAPAKSTGKKSAAPAKSTGKKSAAPAKTLKIDYAEGRRRMGLQGRNAKFHVVEELLDTENFATFNKSFMDTRHKMTGILTDYVNSPDTKRRVVKALIAHDHTKVLMDELMEAKRMMQAGKTVGKGGVRAGKKR